MLAADVILWGKRIGVISAQNISDIPRFEYDKHFITSKIELAPIMMPLSENIYSFPALSYDSFCGLPGMLADSLPDKYGSRLIDEYLERIGRVGDGMSPIEKLCYIGIRGMGALEYHPCFDVEEIEEAVDLEELVVLADAVLSKRRDILLNARENAVRQLIQIGSSAGGARAKALIALNEKTGEIRSGQLDMGEEFSYWLLKFDNIANNVDKGIVPDRHEYTKVEYAYYLMACECGIEMSECRLISEGGGSHFMTKRFDRINGGEKLHMQSLAAIAHFDFNRPGVNSYEQAASVMKKIGLSHYELESVFRRMVFNDLAKNYDDHVKNMSFLMDKKGAWKLAPAYDVTFAFDPNNFWLSSHQMRINGKRENIIAEDMVQTARAFDISEKQAKEMIENVAECIARWPEFAEKAGLSEERMTEIRDYHG